MTRCSVRPDIYQVIEQAAKDIYIRALKDLPPDVRQALVRAADSEQSEIGREILETILSNVAVADENGMLICQDTGIPIYWVRIGTKIGIDGVLLEKAIIQGTARATRDHPLRSSVVAPLTRHNNQTSTGYHIPIIHYEFVEGADYVEVLIVPKGSGSEQMSYLRMLLPADGILGIKRVVLQAVVESGANPCPPIIVGVGLGGTADYCAYLAKRALTRPVGTPNSDPEMAALERELLSAINETGIGPMGMGGLNTALAVHIEHAWTHISQNPVAVNIQCWAARRARVRIYADGRQEQGY